MWVNIKVKLWCKIKAAFDFVEDKFAGLSKATKVL